MSKTEKALVLTACAFAVASVGSALWPRAEAAIPVPPVQQTALGAQGPAGAMLQCAFGTYTYAKHVMTDGGAGGSTTISSGLCHKVTCDNWAHVGARSGCTRTRTATTYCEPLRSDWEGDSMYVYTDGTTLSIASADAGIVTCDVFAAN